MAEIILIIPSIYSRLLSTRFNSQGGKGAEYDDDDGGSEEKTGGKVKEFGFVR